MSAQPLMQCQSCGGLFTPQQKDGSEYFHTCPSRRVSVGATYDKVTGEKLTPTQYVAIDQPRNENIKAVDALGKPVIVNAGKGALLVVDQAVIVAFANPIPEEA